MPRHTATVRHPSVDPVADPESPDASSLGQSEPAKEPAGEQHDRGPAGRRPASLWASALATGLALVLLGGVLVISLRPSLSDAERAAAVGSARTTLESLLSYTGATFDKHVAEVTPHLAAPFKDEFATVATADIKPLAVKNGAVVQARVYEVGVIDTSGDGQSGTTVRVMAFLNQATTTTAAKAPAIDQNRVIATMTKAGDRWLISKLEAY